MNHNNINPRSVPGTSVENMNSGGPIINFYMINPGAYNVSLSTSDGTGQQPRSNMIISQGARYPVPAVRPSHPQLQPRTTTMSTASTDVDSLSPWSSRMSDVESPPRGNCYNLPRPPTPMPPARSQSLSPTLRDANWIVDASESDDEVRPSLMVNQQESQRSSQSGSQLGTLETAPFTQFSSASKN